MANFLHKLVKNSNTSLSRIRFLNSSNLQQIPFLRKPTASPLIPHQTKPGTPVPSLSPGIDENSKLLQSQQLIFPNSPFGFSLDAISASGLRISEETEGNDVVIIRADSVKKKRKKKMNKHKYKKLRKRLRRKAK